MTFGLNEIALTTQKDLQLISDFYIPYKLLKIIKLQNNIDKFMLCKQQQCNPFVPNIHLLLEQIKDVEDKLIGV